LAFWGDGVKSGTIAADGLLVGGGLLLVPGTGSLCTTMLHDETA